MISLIFLGIVFVLIAVRKIGDVRLQIWQIMLMGALGVLVTRQISLSNAAKSIDLDVMLFLFGMFIIGQTVEASGYLDHLSQRLFRNAKSLDRLILYVLFGFGGLSALLMNDTLAIVGTPVVLILARKTFTQPKILLLALAFAVTIGSALSPIGNPQNLLIAVHGDIDNPFMTFLKFLTVPTIVSLFIAYLFLKLYYRPRFSAKPIVIPQGPILNQKQARLSKISLILLVALVFAKIITVFAGFPIEFKLTYIAMISALPIILFDKRRWQTVRHIDWHTLIFFAAMFVLTASVWDSYVIQSVIENRDIEMASIGTDIEMASIGTILPISIVSSQFISNVPLVALYMPMLIEFGASTKALMALAAGSTIAGNLSILGAASNVIIIQNAERKAGQTLTFLEFFRIGLPLTIASAIVFGLWISLVM